MRGGKRKGAGRPPGTFAKERRRKITMSLFEKDIAYLDNIESTRGKAVEKLLAFFKENKGVA
jgi:hypothetical protein